jgi:hypothetical protein
MMRLEQGRKSEKTRGVTENNLFCRNSVPNKINHKKKKIGRVAWVIQAPLFGG